MHDHRHPGQSAPTGSLRRLECLDEETQALEVRAKLPQAVRALAASCGREECFDHVSPAAAPSPAAVEEIVDLGRRILFPGYFNPAVVDQVNLEYHLGQDVTRLYSLLSSQIALAVQHDCLRGELSCRHCESLGGEVALAFIEGLPELRRMMADDVRAAQEGDPAVTGPDEVILTYPGLLAVSVYRLAHVLWHSEVPLLPRMMTEWAHARTGIDIHPAAHIGECFFIDHGTGVVIGATAEIGARVRIYQGVTLGALSLPKEKIAQLQTAKRHPTLEDDVIVYAGATILGGETTVGARSVVGGNVWLVESVPPDSRVLLKKPELEIRKPPT